MSSAILREHQQNPNVPVTQLFTRKELVGKGAYGGVYKGIHNATGQVVALKIIDLDTPDDDISEIQREVQLLSEMRDAARHNITLYHGSYLYGTELWIVMDFASGGSIRTLMKSGKIEEKYIVLILREVLVAMSFLHRQGIIHRDIKAANILLTQVGRIMLADFGVAAHLQTNNKRSTFIGTPLWMAPEVITDGKMYDTKADIWSLGITLYEIATGNPPYFGMEPLRACALIPRSTPTRLEGGNWSAAMREFLAACLQVNPEERPTADELSRHRWIKSANKLSIDILKELIVRYVSWVQMGGQRASLVGMDSLVKDDTFDIEEDDSWDFDDNGEDDVSRAEVQIEPLGDEPPRAANSRFRSQLNQATAVEQQPKRNHPLLRLFEPGSQNGPTSAPSSMLKSSTISLPAGVTDTVRPTISIPSFDEMEEMASTSSASIELPADLLSPATYKPSPFSWTTNAAARGGSSGPSPFGDDEEDDDRFDLDAASTDTQDAGGPFDEPFASSSLHQSVGPSPSLPSLSMNRPFQLNRRRADTAPTFENAISLPPFPPPMMSSLSQSTMSPKTTFPPAHSAKTSISSSGLSSSTGSSMGHRSNDSTGTSWSMTSPTQTINQARPVPTRSRTEILIPPSSDYSNRPFRARVDSDLATRGTSRPTDLSQSQRPSTAASSTMREAFENTRPRNFSDPRSAGRANPGLTLSSIRPRPTHGRGASSQDFVSGNTGLMTAPSMLDNAFDFPTPVATGPSQQFSTMQDSYPFPATGASTNPPMATAHARSASSTLRSSTTRGDSSASSMFDGGHRTRSSVTSLASSEWPLGPPPRPLDYGALLYSLDRDNADEAENAMEKGNEKLRKELETTIGDLASWLAIVDDGLTRILSGQA